MSEADAMPTGLKDFTTFKSIKGFVKEFEGQESQGIIQLARDYVRLVQWMERMVQRSTIWIGTDDNGVDRWKCTGCNVKVTRDDEGAVKVFEAHEKWDTCFMYRLQAQAFKGETYIGQGCHHCGNYFSTEGICYGCEYDVS